jgi:hypothetical protein
VLAVNRTQVERDAGVCDEVGGGAMFRCEMTINMREQFYVNPLAAFEQLVGCAGLQESAAVRRTGLVVGDVMAVQVA